MSPEERKKKEDELRLAREIEAARRRFKPHFFETGDPVQLAWSDEVGVFLDV